MNDLTVAICMYNAERYVWQTLQCIVSQTMQNFDLLIVDDCSTDASVDSVRRFFSQHPRQYQLVQFDENHGIAYARNQVLHLASTKYIIFIDSDDLPLPQLLEKEYNAINCDQELMAVSSWLQFVDTNCNRLKGGLFIGDTDKDSFRERAQRKKLIFLPIQTMFNRECALRVGGFRVDGFPEGKPRYRDYCEDLDLWTRMSDLYSEGRAIIVLPEVLYLYRKADNLSSNHFNMIVKMRYVKRNLLLRRDDREELSFIDFMESVSPKELRALKNESVAADCLRNGVFCLRERKLFKGVYLILKSIVRRPSYFYDKLKYNLLKKKK